MGMLDKILPRRKKEAESYAAPYRSVTEWSPTFVPYDGGTYGQALTRAAIDRIATACSKLTPHMSGDAKPAVRRAIETHPNSFQTWDRFLYRTATIMLCDSTAAVVPVFGEDLQTVRGIYALRFSSAEVVDMDGTPWVRFHMPTGEVRAMELANTCFVSRFQYESDFFGTANVLDSTMSLIDAQEQAQEMAIENGATIRFIGAVNGMLKDEDITEKRRLFTEQNLKRDSNGSGLLIYDNTFQSVQQVDPQSYTIDSEEMERIKSDIYAYFAVNEDIMEAKFDENTWDAFYETSIEPFAVQLGNGLTKMLFTQREQAYGNSIGFSASRLAYSSNASKRNMIRDMVDRGIMSINEAREVLQLEPVEGGDRYVIRGEYIDMDTLSARTVEEALDAKAGDISGNTDTEKADSEANLFDTDAKGQKDEPDNDDNVRK